MTTSDRPNRIAVVSKYFGYAVGGAERSAFQMMKDLESQGNTIVAVKFDNISSYGADQHRMNFPNTWEIVGARWQTDIIRFRYIGYYLNKRSATQVIGRLKGVNELYSYGFYAPALINAFEGNSTYMVRDEYGLGWNNNYYSGLRKAMQSIYHLIEYPFWRSWKKELLCAMHKSRLIANSKFIASELGRLAPDANITISYPGIDFASLQNDYSRYNDITGRKGIVAIGDNILKGGDIIRKISKLLPHELFYLFDRQYHSATPISGNLLGMPWQSPGRVYAHAKLVLVPSRWQEAFCRIIPEAQHLEIPVIASRRGGIPESYKGDTRYLVEDFENPAAWITRIKELLAHSPHKKEI